MTGLNEQGRAVFGTLVPDGEQRLDTIFRAAPGLGELAVGTVYGHLHARPTLDPRLREACALAAIIASGMVDTPWSVHVRTGLAAGLTPAEIAEILVETAAFAGFPRAVTAAGRFADLLTELGSPVPPAPAPREVLLALLDTADADLPGEQLARVRALLAGDTPPQVLTTGPDTAVALFHDADGALRAVAQARVSGDRVRELLVLE